MQAPISVEGSWQPSPAIQAGVDAYLSLRWVARGSTAPRLQQVFRFVVYTFKLRFGSNLFSMTDASLPWATDTLKEWQMSPLACGELVSSSVLNQCRIDFHVLEVGALPQ
jgi:hypothetical protein